MNERYFWKVFEKTGNIEAYLSYALCRHYCDLPSKVKKEDILKIEAK